MSIMLLHCPRECRTAFIVHLATLFKNEKTQGRTPVHTDNSKRTDCLATHHPRPHWQHKVHRMFWQFTVGAIRRYIRRKFTKKQRLTLGTLATELMTEGSIPEPTSQTIVWRLIHIIGLIYKVSRSRLYVREESQDIVSRRINTLKALQRYWNENTKIIYVDKTWFTQTGP